MNKAKKIEIAVVVQCQEDAKKVGETLQATHGAECADQTAIH